MKEYTYQDMLKMQDDALRRVREMQKMSQTAVEPEETVRTKVPDTVKRIPMPVEFAKKNVKEREKTDTPAQYGFVDLLNNDSDIIIILSLIILLGQENADMPLILALAYILL